MADQFNWDIIVRFAAQGVKGTTQEIDGAVKSVEQLNKEGKITPQTFDNFSKSAVRAGRATEGIKDGASEATSSIISLRYANYDLSRSMFTVAAAATAMGVGLVAAYASQQSAFTDVERTLAIGTLPAQIKEIEGALKSLSTQVPLTFQELAQIATIGNQMGVAADDVVAFTGTISRFAAITGLSVENVTKAFGGFMAQTGLAPDLLENLGSAIAKVGIDSNATEEQILSLMREITAGATGAGFAADQIVALSGTLASLQIAPERARGSLTTYFETLNKAVAGGGEDLENFAKVVGVTSGELDRLVRAGEGNQVLRGFLEGLKDLDNVDTTRALDELGLAQLRVSDTFRRLSNSLHLYDRDQQNANESFRAGTELQRQYGFILDDLATKWQVFLNAANNAAAAVGASLAPAIGTLLDSLTGVLAATERFASSDIGGVFFRIAGAVLILVSAYGVLRGSIALATASLQAFAFISAALGGSGIRAGLTGLAGAFGLVRNNAAGAAGAVGLFAGASARGGQAATVLANGLKVLGKATIVLALLQGASELIFNFGGAMEWLQQPVNAAIDVFVSFGQIVVGIVGSVLDLIGLLPGAGVMTDWANALFHAVSEMENFKGSAKKEFGNWVRDLNSGSDATNEFSSALGDVGWSGFEEGAYDGAGALEDFGGAAGGAAEEVRTLKDYANDLQSVFSRAFEIRFSSGSTLDAITSTFIQMREASEEAARNIAKLKAEIQGLESDLNIQQYFLGIAIEYGDTKRAEAIQANIAKLQAELAGKTADLSEEQAKNSKELTGNSKAAIANRKQLEGLVQQYQEHITALAASGMGQAELAQRTAELRQQFLQQAAEMGYNRLEVEKYAAAFDDMGKIIASVPRNITLSVDANPAITALREYEAALDKARANSGRGISAPNITNPTNAREVRRLALEAEILASAAMLDRLRALGEWTGVRYQMEGLARLRHALASGSYADGGFTGRGGKYEPAGVVHRGEYVIPKEQVNQRTGLPYANALGQLQRGTPGPGYARGGYVGPSNSATSGHIASFGPMAYQQLHQALQQIVTLDGKVISNNTAQQNAESNRVGAA